MAASSSCSIQEYANSDIFLSGVLLLGSSMGSFLLVALTVGHARQEQDGHGADREGLEQSQGGRPSDPLLQAQRPPPHSSPPGELRLLGIIQLVCFDFCEMNVIV